jgi:hypothetical protein
LHELDIQLELYSTRCSNIRLISSELSEKFGRQAKRHEGVRDNFFERSIDNLRINNGHRVLKIIRDLDATKRAFKFLLVYSCQKKIQYVRYVDHFILAVMGDKKCAYDVLVFIAMILDSLWVKLSIEKSGVNSPVKGVVFLGYHIYSQCLFNTN